MTALDRLVAANPVPDETRLLDRAGAMDAFVLTVLERSGIVEPTKPSSDTSTVTPISEEMQHIEVQRRPQRRGPLIALGVAAVALVVVAAGVIIAQQGTDAPSIPVAGIDGDPDALEAFAAIEAAYETYNRGDVATWALVRSQGNLDPEADSSDPTFLAFFEADMAADARYELDRCTYQGFGEWANLIDSGDMVTGHYFTCTALWSNRLHDAGNVTATEDFRWVVADGAVVAVQSDQAASEADRFSTEFRNWLATAHPEVEVEFHEWGMPLAESMPTALEYVDEFVEQSPDWPLTP